MATATNNLVEVSGNTYPVKEQIKRLGGRWNSFKKVWMVPASKAEQAQALVDEQPVRLGSRYKSGRRPCEDAPCCGCCGPQGDGDYYGYYQGDF